MQLPEMVWFAHHFPACFSLSLHVSLPLSASTAVAPQEQLSVMDGLSNHITVSEEAWRQKHRTRSTKHDQDSSPTYR